MNALISLHMSVFDRISRADGALSLLARFLFAAIFVFYFWVSGLTKLGDGVTGIFNPSLGAYAQIFPRAMEAAGYDVNQLGPFHTLVVLAGTWAEFVLPVLIITGLFTRLAAIGMSGFIAVQTVTHLVGHGVWSEAATVGAWFDKAPNSLIMDQRALWIFLLIVLVIKGAGPLSLDRVLSQQMAPRTKAFRLKLEPLN